MIRDTISRLQMAASDVRYVRRDKPEVVEIMEAIGDAIEALQLVDSLRLVFKIQAEAQRQAREEAGGDG